MELVILISFGRNHTDLQMQKICLAVFIFMGVCMNLDWGLMSKKEALNLLTSPSSRKALINGASCTPNPEQIENKLSL